MPLQLRDYQSNGIQLARQRYATGVKRLIIVAPTGAGKTVTAAYMAMSHLERNPNNRVLFIASGIELIRQSSDAFWDLGIPNGVVMAKWDDMPEHRVQIASKETLDARCIRTSRMPLPPATLIIPDEAHESLSRGWLKIFERYPDAYFAGLTATPIRGDGRSLAGWWQDLVVLVSYETLLNEGHLVPVRVFAPSEPDLKGIKVSQGDYHQGQLQDRMDKVELVGDVVEHWLKHASDRQTVVFASGVEHSIHLRDEFRKHAIKAEHIDGNTDADERHQIEKALESGDIQVITNYGCLRRGWDCPPCSCAVICQPTKKLGMYRQMVGRILRPYPGKTDALILDHAGAVHRHGWPTDDIDWTLEPEANVQRDYETKRKRDTSDTSKEPITCKQCHAVRQGGRVCPACGFEPKRQGAAADIADGQLTEIQRANLEHNKRVLAKASKDKKKAEWDRCVGICIQFNWPIKRACGMYKQKFGVWPRGFDNMPRGHAEFQMPARDWYQVLVSRAEQEIAS